jgi:hypothetical protein
MGRYLCNTLDEAIDSVGQTVAGKSRDFDVIVVGGGSFGSVVANGLFMRDRTRSRRILVLEQGPFVLPSTCRTYPSWALIRATSCPGSCGPGPTSATPA